ncbi:hypothetical protein GWN91_03100, partial [Candidatus Saccharibacteria bacterium]|nr:hypothetical protein [Candidatus Saccharibacteria bacterium]NIW79841.1 hypothetical protein [Calditrichia bacterium]
KLRTVNAVNALAVFRVTLISLFGFALIFLAIRGRISAKSPIRWGTAFFSNYAFANQLGLNPLYTFG